MSHSKVILKRLKHYYEDVGAAEGAYLVLDPIDILGKPGDTKYVAAVNQLLREKLILAVVPKGGDKPAFSLNPARMDDVVKELSWMRSPAIPFLVPTLTAPAGLF